MSVDERYGAICSIKDLNKACHNDRQAATTRAEVKEIEKAYSKHFDRLFREEMQHDEKV